MSQEPGPYTAVTYSPDPLIEVNDSDTGPDGGADQAKHVAQTAKDQAAEVGSTAKDAGGHVAGVAQEQVRNVASEASDQVRNIAGQATAEAQQQATAQQQRAAAGLHSIGDQLKSMAGNAEQSGVVTDLTHEAADRVHEIAGWLDQRDPGAILGEVKDFARRRPGTFLLVAAGAGLVAGRLTRGLTADKDDASSSTTSSTSASTAPTTAPGGFSTPVAPVVETDPFPAAPASPAYPAASGYPAGPEQPAFPEPPRDGFFEERRG